MALTIEVVPARVLRRMIRDERRVGGFGREVPHAHGWVRDDGGRDVLVLPDAALTPEARWRRLYGLAVFGALQRAGRTGALPLSVVRERLHHLGQVELDEVRAVLRKERRLLPPLPTESADGLTWSLFAALWTELEAFDRAALAWTFPTLEHRALRALIARDVPLDALLAATRPPDATAPTPSPTAPDAVASHAAPVSAIRRARLVAKAARAERRGDELAAVRALAAAGQDVTARAAAYRADVRPDVAAIVAGAVAPPSGLVEAVARDKLVDELLDRLLDKGRLDFPALRDAVSRNAAKLADPRPRELVFDPLLGADRRLAKALPGAHRRAEIYRRGLHHLSALLFGTALGRPLTKLLLIPAIGAYGVLETLQHTVVLGLHALTGVELELVTWPALIALALVVFGLVNVPVFRASSLRAARALGRGLVTVFVRAPRWLFTRPWLAALVRSAPARALWDFVLEPALVALPLELPLALGAFDLPPPARHALTIGAFIATLVVLRSPLGARLEDALIDGAVAVRRAVTATLVPALVRWILAVFKAFVEAVERGLYAVEERLRIAPGSSPLRVALLTALALPWRALAYVLRLYLNVFLEPKYNPVKHFPAVTIGHKLILPMSFELIAAFEKVLSPLGPTLATAVATTTVFVLPGLFGFLAWELKENWRLYEANRPATLRPVVIGSHGEAMPRLLRPGFHSGTLPRLFAKLRRAAARPTTGSDADRRARRLAALERERHHLAQAIADFVARDVLALAFGPADAAPAAPVPVVTLASNRVTVALGAMTLTFEEQSGLIVADVAPPDVVGGVGGELAEPLARALTGAWRKAGVDLLRRNLAARAGGAPYDVDDRGDGPVLVVWPGPGYAREEVKPLDDLRLDRAPLGWAAWVASWPLAARARG